MVELDEKGAIESLENLSEDENALNTVQDEAQMGVFKLMRYKYLINRTNSNYENDEQNEAYGCNADDDAYNNSTDHGTRVPGCCHR